MVHTCNGLFVKDHFESFFWLPDAWSTQLNCIELHKMVAAMKYFEKKNTVLTCMIGRVCDTSER